MKIFRKIKSFFSCKSAQPSPSRDLPSVEFELRMQGLDEFAWKFVDNRVEFFLLLGYQVTVKPLQTQIPDEYIGLIIHRDEGCRCTEWKEYLGIKVESVKKGIPVFRRIRPSDIPVAPTVWDKYPPTEYTPKV